MGTSSEEFVDVDVIPAADVAAAGGLARWIVANVLGPLRAPPPGAPPKSVLFFPPRREPWVLTGVDWPLVLPREVEVRVAPGARVVPKGSASLLVIQGPLVAPVQQIFEVPDADLTSADAIGRVQLLGDRQRVVHPEWWGAGRGVAAVDTAALQEAVFVALDRVDPLRVELLGRYALRQPVELRDRPVVVIYAPGAVTEFPQEGARGVELHGRPSAEGAVLRCDDAFVGEALLVASRASPAVTLRAVSLDARGKAPSCVVVELPVPEAGGVARVAHALRHCTLAGARTALLAVKSAPPVASVAPLAARVPMLEASACTFLPTRDTVAARLAGPRGAVVDFRGCTFAGEALAMIHVLGMGVVATSCRFDNRQVPEKLRASARDRQWNELHRNGPDGGVDILIDHEQFIRVVRERHEDRLPPAAEGALAVLLPSVYTVYALATQGPLRTYVQESFGAPGWVTAQDCRSSSLQFIATSRRPLSAPPPPGARDSVVIGLHHACDPAPLGLLRAQLPPSVQWWIALSTGCALTLMGCRFDALTGDVPRVQVFGAHADDAVRAPLFEYGVCSADRVIQTRPGGGVLNEDVFAAFEPGRVPYRPYR